MVTGVGQLCGSEFAGRLADVQLRELMGSEEYLLILIAPHICEFAGVSDALCLLGGIEFAHVCSCSGVLVWSAMVQAGPIQGSPTAAALAGTLISNTGGDDLDLDLDGTGLEYCRLGSDEDEPQGLTHLGVVTRTGASQNEYNLKLSVSWPSYLVWAQLGRISTERDELLAEISQELADSAVGACC